MLSYRHGFHAGNFADVFKHTLLLAVLDYLKRKAKPLAYIDTHAGAGGYDLATEFAQKTREYADGIGRLWSDAVSGEEAPEAVRRYLDRLHALNPDGHLRHYPGSPALARMLLGPEDRLWLFERHRNECAALQNWSADDRRITVRQEDGYTGCIGLLPPPSKRALLLMDPAYEVKTEDGDAVKSLQAAHRRFATGVFLLWYPVVERRRAERMIEALLATGIRRIERYELGREPDRDGHGMTASGMVVINPPFVLSAQMATALPWLAERLGDDGGGWWRSETLVGE